MVGNIKELFSNVKVYKHKKKQWYNISNAFDIETTSFYEGDEKRAIMYVWQWAIGTDLVIYGRTWDEFQQFIALLVTTLELSEEKRIVCYVHNLAYETQFIKHYFKIFNLLATKPYKPIRYTTSAGIEFRCSYLLTQQSLDTLSKNYKLKYYKKHNYNYDLIRNSKTELTPSEIDYICSDVLAVNEYIGIELQEYRKITLIPNTATAKVRQQTRLNTVAMTHSGGKDNSGALKYADLMQCLILQPDELKLAHQCYAGGLTHSNALNTNVTLYNVGSQDFTSSYPAVMVLSAEFPIGQGKRVQNVNKQCFEHLMDYYAVFCNVTFFNIKPKTYEQIISLHKCLNISSDAEINNGRVVSAGSLNISITHVMYKLIQKFYTWDKMIVNDLYYYPKGYLPKKFVMSVLDYYELKTTLKGVHSEDGLAEINYLRYKGYVNSLYGMCCLFPAKPTIKITDEGEWIEDPVDFTKAVEKYNKDKGRFISYLWGVIISDVAKSNLCLYGILPLGKDYVYADTDSVKYLHPEQHKDIFESYNKMMRLKIKRVSEKRRIPIEKFMPCTPAGEQVPLGFWTDEGVYDRFRTCGSKRYITEKNGKLEITVAGLNKKAGAEFLLKCFDDPFEAFNEDLYIPKGCTGKQTHTYCEYEIKGKIKDYQGNIADYHELSFIHLEDADYDFNIATDYIKYLLGVKINEKSY